MDKTDEFFAFAKERHNIYLRRRRGLDRSEWTGDRILQDWYFTNVYRELDKTTQWFRENVRDNLRESKYVLPATVLFRWFNRIDMGELIFKTVDERFNDTMFEAWMKGELLPQHFIQKIKHRRPEGPYVNGAYIIKGYDGMDKLSGVTYAFRNWFLRGYNDRELFPKTMEGMTKWLASFDQLGMFMAYEVACDLRYTKYLDSAPDILTWANPGPGARRGLSRIYFDHPYYKFSTDDCIWRMQNLLGKAYHDDFWEVPWEMREVEHTLCEFDKYERIRQGGRGKRRYG